MNIGLTRWPYAALATLCAVFFTAIINGCTPLGVTATNEWALVASNHVLEEGGNPLIGLGSPQREQPSGSLLTLYIGGDGNPGSQSDPSSLNPLAQRLAAKDPGSWVVGRPCYQLALGHPGCAPHLWQSGRYGESVLTAMTEVIQQLLSHTGYERVRLIGYSGGGTLAVLLSDRLTNVTEVITLAAPLDVAAWASARGASVPEASFDPAKHHRVGGASNTTRYLHLVGGRDGIVPLRHAEAYSARFPQEHFRTFPLYDHVCCWARDWSDILSDIIER